MTSTRKATGSRAFIARRNIPCLEKLSSLASYQSGWRSVLIRLLHMTESCHGCSFLPFNLPMANLLGCFPPWSATSNVVSRHWLKLSVNHRLPRGERGKCFLVTGLALGWRCPTPIWWHGLHYTILPSFSLAKSRRKVYILHIIITLRSHYGYGPT